MRRPKKFYRLLIGLMVISISGVAPVLSQNSPVPGRVVNTAPGQTETASTPAILSPAQLIQQGKALYRAVRLKDALEKFEEALRLEQNPAARDEALGLAAITAFRLDNQPLSRKYFMQRAALADQKSSVKAFCHYRIALTFWREVHDKVASRGAIEGGQFVQSILATDRPEMEELISGGLKSIDETLRLVENYPEAYNIRNLLYAEAALLEGAFERSNSLRSLSIEALTRAVDLTAQATLAGRKNEVADFSQPTVRLTEFSRNIEEETSLRDPMLKMIEGGYPIKRANPVFPPIKAQKAEPKSDVTSGEPATTPAPQSNTVKIEVLVSTNGDVAFASQVDGRTEFGPSAILAARGWKFEPARLNGRPIQVSGQITFEVKQTKGR